MADSSDDTINQVVRENNGNLIGKVENYNQYIVLDSSELPSRGQKRIAEPETQIKGPATEEKDYPDVSTPSEDIASTAMYYGRSFLSLFILISIGIVVVSTIYTESLKAGLVFGGVAFSVLEFVLPWVIARYVYRNIEHRYQLFINGLVKSLTRVDYLGFGEWGAIAVNVGERKIATTSSSKANEISIPRVFDVRQIRKFEAYCPKVSDPHCLAEVQCAKLDMGIYLQIDDIDSPNIHVQMSESTAKRWMLLLEKLLENSLPSQEKPIIYPKL